MITMVVAAAAAAAAAAVVVFMIRHLCVSVSDGCKERGRILIENSFQVRFIGIL